MDAALRETRVGSTGRRRGAPASMAVSWGTPAGLTAEELLPEEARRREVEQEVRQFATSGRGVILYSCSSPAAQRRTTASTSALKSESRSCVTRPLLLCRAQDRPAARASCRHPQGRVRAQFPPRVRHQCARRGRVAARRSGRRAPRRPPHDTPLPGAELAGPPPDLGRRSLRRVASYAWLDRQKLT